MAIEENDRNLIELEKKAGQKAARTIQRNLGIILSTTTTKRTGKMLSWAGASAEMKFDMLNAVTIQATQATFIQHYGFEGIKKNGIYMSLKPYSHFDNLFNKSSSALERLLEEITELRGQKVVSRIQDVIKFNFDKSQS
jgi:hypothetical protein